MRKMCLRIWAISLSLQTLMDSKTAICYVTYCIRQRAQLLNAKPQASAGTPPANVASSPAAGGPASAFGGAEYQTMPRNGMPTNQSPAFDPQSQQVTPLLHIRRRSLKDTPRKLPSIRIPRWSWINLCTRGRCRFVCQTWENMTVSVIFSKRCFEI